MNGNTRSPATSAQGQQNPGALLHITSAGVIVRYPLAAFFLMSVAIVVWTVGIFATARVSQQPAGATCMAQVSGGHR